MEKQVTQWFSGDLKPARTGLYECERKELRSSELVRRKLLWDGKLWRYTETDDKAVAGRVAVMWPSDGDRWRGLASNPNGGANG